MSITQNQCLHTNVSNVPLGPSEIVYQCRRVCLDKEGWQGFYVLLSAHRPLAVSGRLKNEANKHGISATCFLQHRGLSVLPSWVAILVEVGP